MKYKWLSLALLLLLMTSMASAQPARPITIDREASEAAFLRAYDYFLKNRLWNSLNSLDEALKNNTYFVDIYYLSSLANHRLGRYPEAIRAMEFYLEVRRDDHRGRLILSSMQEEWEIAKRYLYPGKLDAEYRFTAQLARDFLTRSRFLAPFTLRPFNGIGKIASSPSLLLIPDTLGNELHLFAQGEKEWRNRVALDAPTAVSFITPDEALVFQQSGDIQKVQADKVLNVVHVQPMGKIEGNIVDGVAISSSLIAAADRTGQAVRFYSLETMREEGSWSPETERKRLFEPVALAAFGPLLAVVDRGNSMVTVLDSYTLRERKNVEVPLARDLVWGDQGELYVLTETGELYVVFPTAGDEEPRVVLEGLQNAWSVSWANNAPLITDINGRMWWSGFPILPSNRPHIGAVTLTPKWIEGERGEERLHLVGSVGGIFHGYIAKGVPDAHSVWRTEVLSTRVVPEIKEDTEKPLYYSTVAQNTPGVQPVVAPNIQAVMADIKQRSLSGDVFPRVIVLDSRIEARDYELVNALPFFLKQGIRVDLVAIDRPATVILSRLSRITSGHTYFNWPSGTEPRHDQLLWNISLPLPVDTVTFGFPSDATLSFYADMHSIQFRDWLPVWTTLVERKKVGSDDIGKTN